jgi:hypothetical protein
MRLIDSVSAGALRHHGTADYHVGAHQGAPVLIVRDSRPPSFANPHFKFYARCAEQTLNFSKKFTPRVIKQPDEHN